MGVSKGFVGGTYHERLASEDAYQMNVQIQQDAGCLYRPCITDESNGQLWLPTINNPPNRKSTHFEKNFINSFG